MVEFAQFVGQNDNHFIGTIVFVLGCCWGLSWVVGAFRGRP